MILFELGAKLRKELSTRTYLTITSWHQILTKRS